MNCRNCGMPLTGPKCEYCGTDYSAELGTIVAPRQPVAINWNFDAGELEILYEDDRAAVIKAGGITWDEDGLHTTPLSDTTITAEVQSGWRWNL